MTNLLLDDIIIPHRDRSVTMWDIIESRYEMSETIMTNYEQWLNMAEMPENKRKILEATIRLYSKQGISNTSTSQIAKEAGFSKALIFKFFTNKHDLTMNLLTPILDHILPAFTSNFFEDLEKKAEVKEIIHYIVFNRYQFLMENKEIVLIFLSEILINEELQQDFFSYIDSNNKNNWTREHSLFSKIDEKITLTSLFSAIASQILMLFVQCLIFNKKMTEQQQNQRLEEIVDLIYNGVKNRKE